MLIGTYHDEVGSRLAFDSLGRGLISACYASVYFLVLKRVYKLMVFRALGSLGRDPLSASDASV